MIKNFFKVAVRNLWKHKGYSFLNIFGLAMGLACSLLILLWIRDEKNVDAFHAKGDRLYRVYERQYYDGKIEAGYFTPGGLAVEMKKVLPEVEMSAGFSWAEKHTFQVGNKILNEKGGAAGTDYFRMFSFPLLEGSAASALATISDMAISRKMAVDLFGSPQGAIGKTLRYDNRKVFTVSSVFENLPENVSEKYDYVMNWEAFQEDNSWTKEWGNNGPTTFLLLRKDADAARFTKKITRFLDNYNKEQNKNFHIELGMSLAKDVYLHSNFKNGEISGGRIEYVRLFGIVAIFILLIACINFMNLTTARSVNRAKEIGIRKVVGAVRPALVRQFISEAVLLAFFSMILALAMVVLILPFFNQLTQKKMVFPYGSGTFWLWMAALTVVTGAIAGSYPALFLSSFKPIKVLKGTLKFGSGAAWFRKGLVVFQFVLSIVLIIGTIVVASQVNYVMNANLGFDRENLVYIPLEGDLTAKYKVFKEQALRMPGIGDVTRSAQAPFDIGGNTGGVDWDGKDPNVLPMFTQLSVGYDLAKTLKLKFVEGRDFSPAYATDSVGYILNEAALKKIGYKHPIGRRLTFWDKKGAIVGVVKDFHYNSLHLPIYPLIIRLAENEGWGEALIRTKPGQTRQVLAGLERLCKELNPKFPFTYRFADEEYQKSYESEMVVQHLSNCFAGLAIFISCLGLLGLAMFTAEQRTKEFGIRKVLGAKVSTLFSLLSREFVVLVLVAFVVASPLAWWAMHVWLQNFAYHIDVQWWVFLLAGMAALLITLLTVSWQAMKVAVANPVKSLRAE